MNLLNLKLSSFRIMSMEASSHSPWVQSPIYLIVMVGVIMLCVHLIGLVTQVDLSVLGIYPKSLTGIIGIIFYPFIHGDISHIAGNLLPLLVGLYLLLTFYKPFTKEVLLWVWFAGGLMIWAFGRESYHIGSSGILYGINFFILTDSLIHRNLRTLSLAMIIILLNEGLFWGLLPINYGISWEGHLFSALVGINVAIQLRDEIAKHTQKEDEPCTNTPELPEQVWRYTPYVHFQEKMEED